MKKMFTILLMITLILGMSACGSSGSERNTSSGNGGDGTGYPKLKLKISTSGTDQGIDAIAANYFAGIVEEASGGNIKITVYPNCQLAGGSMPKSIELLIAGGNYEMAVFSGSVLGNIDEKLLTHSIPFIFDSYKAASEKMDGTGGEYYTKLFKEKGLVYMSGMHNGLRQLTSNTPVVTPEDLKGLKIRVPSGEVYMKTLGMFGADPVAMNWSEVFTALQQGTIDGHENGYQTIDSANIYEVQKYMTEWSWSYDGYWLMANQKDWATFDEATQKLLMEKAQDTAIYARKLLEDTEVELKQKFINSGVTIAELTEAQRAAFIEAARPAHEYFIKKFGAEACKAWGLE